MIKEKGKMNENLRKAGRRKAETVIRNLAKRNMEGFYCEDREEAVERILSLIPEGSEVAWGGSMTLGEIGIKGRVKEGNFTVNDPMSHADPAEALQARRRALSADVFLSSLNAITLDGEIVNIDGTGNRVAAIIFGPGRVILVAGVNKIVLNEDCAVERIKSDACPANCIRLDKNTPCAATGQCRDCLIKGETVCCHTVTTRFSFIDDRIKVVLVNEDLGF